MTISAVCVTGRAVCRAVSKLHEAISGVLTSEHSRRLFARMNAAFVDSLRRRVVKLNIKSDGGPQHGSVAEAEGKGRRSVGGDVDKMVCLTIEGLGTGIVTATGIAIEG